MLFLPVVVAARWVETKFAWTMIQTFFNAEIIAASWPIVRAGLRNTVLLSLLVVPLGLFGGLLWPVVRLLSRLETRALAGQ